MIGRGESRVRKAAYMRPYKINYNDNNTDNSINDKKGDVRSRICLRQHRILNSTFQFSLVQKGYYFISSIIYIQSSER